MTDETELRLIRRGKYLVPDRNYDYFVLKGLMFKADLSQFHGIRLLADSDQYDKVLAVSERTICVTYVDNVVSELNAEEKPHGDT